MASPLHHHSRSGSSSTLKRPQNTKAAAQRLAKVMAYQPADDEEEDDDLYDFDSAIPSAGIGLAGGRQPRNRSPMSVRSSVDLPQSLRSRPSGTVNSTDQQPLSARSGRSPLVWSSQSKPVEPPLASAEETQTPSARYFNATGRSSISRPSQSRTVEPQPSSKVARPAQQRDIADEEAQSPYARPERSPSYAASIEQPSSARPNLRVKTAAMPPSVPQTNRTGGASGTPSGTQTNRSKDKRLSLDFGTFKYKEPNDQQCSSALQDELDMLQEENDNLLEKLRIAEERCEEAESRTRQLEKQIASLGEGVSLEARLLSRKEAEIQKREAALKVAAQTYGGSGEEIAALRTEAETARDDATAALEQLREVESEVKSLRVRTQRMILTQDETEEVVLKRCWLARYWSLCVRFGIHAEIADARHQYWSSLVSRPVELILAAGRKAKDENFSMNTDLEEREKVIQDLDEFAKKATVESMLLVDKGLKELTSLKVEEAVAISMAQQRRPTFVKSDELKLPIEGNNFSEAFELSPEECDDVLLKQAWLSYFWRRANKQGLEPDIAEERLQFWINQPNKPPTSQDAVYAERGLVEMRKLGIDTKLWEESRRLIDPDSSEKTLSEIESQMLS